MIMYVRLPSPDHLGPCRCPGRSGGSQIHSWMSQTAAILPMDNKTLGLGKHRKGQSQTSWLWTYFCACNQKSPEFDKTETTTGYQLIDLQTAFGWSSPGLEGCALGRWPLVYPGQSPLQRHRHNRQGDPLTSFTAATIVLWLPLMRREQYHPID